MLTTLLTLTATLVAAPDAGVGTLRPPFDWTAEFRHRPASDAGADPDAARALAAALARDMEAQARADALLATRAGQRLVNSAILCQVVAALMAEGRSTTTARRRLAVIGEAATARMERARIVPLACDAYPVERLVGCLGLLPGPECTTDADMAAQVRAAERLGSP